MSARQRVETGAMNDAQRQTAASIARKRVLEAYGNNGAGSNAANPANSVNSAGVVNGGYDNASYANTNNYAASGSDLNQNQGNGTHLKDQPMESRINSESWKRYHSAWQNYYQKYYSQYYAQAARNYVERERLRDARKQAEEDEVLESLIVNGRSQPTGAQRMVGKLKRGGGEEEAGTTGTVVGAGAASAGGATGAANAVAAAAQAEADNAETIGAQLKKTIRKKALKSAKKSRRHRKWIPIVAGIAVVLIILFMQYNRMIFAPIFAYVSPGNAPASEIEAINPTVTQNVSAEPRLIIPKLNIDVPVYFGIQLSEVMGAMNNGVAHYRIAGASAFPGEIGNTIITGHSAGDVYSSNPYKYIFSGLERLEEGDLIYIHYNSVRYTYQVKRKEVVEPTDVAALIVDTDVPMLTLVTCTPLGTSRYRLLVFADQISPSPDGAAPTDTTIEVEDGNEPEESDGAELPSNEPSFFENIWSFLTGGE